MRSLLALAVALAATAGPLVAQSTDATAGDGETQVLQPADLTAEQFVTAAAGGDAFEIATSEVVLNAPDTREDVRGFAQQMIQDHTANSTELQAAAEAAGLTPPPAALDDRRSDMVQALTDADPATLDNAYLEMQLNSHIESIALYSAYAGRDDALGAFAAEKLPVLQMHEQMVRELIGS